jgi:hypothetical protein
VTLVRSLPPRDPSLMALPTNLRSTPRSSGFERAELQGAYGGFHVTVSRNDRDGEVGAVLLDPGDEIETIAVGQTHVGETKIEFLRLQQPPRGTHIGGGARLQVHAAQREADELEQVGLIIHDQHGGFVHVAASAVDRLDHES